MSNVLALDFSAIKIYLYTIITFEFDEDVDITSSLDTSKAKRVLHAQRPVNVDFPK